VTAQSDLQAIDRDLAASLSRSYFAGQTVLGDSAKTEALVIEAVQSLDPEDVTSNAIRDAVVERLVQPQIGRNKCSKKSAMIAGAFVRRFELLRSLTLAFGCSVQCGRGRELQSVQPNSPDLLDSE
jgi:hypothetical protein